jgi:hypothetical protein
VRGVDAAKPVTLVDALATSAAKYAHRALAAYVDDELNDFYFFGGVALEKAIKARLGRENPVFVASRNFPSAVALWRARDDIRKLPTGTMTIGGKEGVERLTALEPPFAPLASGVQEILVYRNGEAHVGVVDETQRRRGLVSFLRAVNYLLRHHPDTFWHPHGDLVRVALDENAKAISQKVAFAVGRAKQRYHQRVDALDPGHREGFDAVVLSEVERQLADDIQQLECPACASPATIQGENYVEAEPAFGKEGDIEGVDAWIEFHARSFKCGACGLELQGDDELRAAGLETMWLNETIGREEFLQEYYGDEHWDRF